MRRKRLSLQSVKPLHGRLGLSAGGVFLFFAILAAWVRVFCFDLSSIRVVWNGWRVWSLCEGGVGGIFSPADESWADRNSSVHTPAALEWTWRWFLCRVLGCLPEEIRPRRPSGKTAAEMLVPTDSHVSFAYFRSNRGQGARSFSRFSSLFAQESFLCFIVAFLFSFTEKERKDASFLVRLLQKWSMRLLYWGLPQLRRQGGKSQTGEEKHFIIKR